MLWKGEQSRKGGVMQEKGFSIGEALHFGFLSWKSRPFFYSGIALFAVILPLIPYIFLQALPSGVGFTAFLLNLIYFSLVVIAEIGFCQIALLAARKESIVFSDFFSKTHLFFPYLLAEILYFLAIFFGLLLLIIPGIYFAIRFSLFRFFIVDRSFSAIDALKASSQATVGVKWDLLLFGIAAVILNIIGLLLFGIGALITTPITWFAFASIYVKLTNLSAQESN